MPVCPRRRRPIVDRDPSPISGAWRRRRGRASFSILLAQDLAVVPILLFVSHSRLNSTGGTVAEPWHWRLAQAALAIGDHRGRRAAAAASRCSACVGSAGTSELFVAATLFVIVGTGGDRRRWPGLSMALGASRCRAAAGRDRVPQGHRDDDRARSRACCSGVFFFTVGMSHRFPRAGARALCALFACVVGLIGHQRPC